MKSISLLYLWLSSILLSFGAAIVELLLRIWLTGKPVFPWETYGGVVLMGLIPLGFLGVGLYAGWEAWRVWRD